MYTKNMYSSFILLLFISCFSVPIYGQLGYSSAAMSMGKSSANSNGIPTPRQMVVAEFMNYHKHELPSPKNNAALSLDIDSYIELDGSAIVQVGLSSGFVKDINQVPPVNVCLVIDRSGSMSGDRIAKAKEAAVEFVKRLREKDIISVVLFDNQVDVLIEAQHVTNKEKLISKIQSVEVRGSTDLNAGLLKGYDEVIKNYMPNQNNRVIMLTDAIANTGDIDPLSIIKQSNAKTAELEIDITLVGIGYDFNNDLSREITNSKRCSMFFINDSEDIKKVFIDEIESLLSPIAHDVTLQIELSHDLEIAHFFGYSPVILGNTISLELENINSGLTQIIVMKLKQKDNTIESPKQAFIRAELVYKDVAKAQTDRIESTATVFSDESKKKEDLQKNYTISRMAQCLRDMAEFYENGKIDEAERRVKFILNATIERYPLMEDQDIKRIYDMLTKYNLILENVKGDAVSTNNFPY